LTWAIVVGTIANAGTASRNINADKGLAFVSTERLDVTLDFPQTAYQGFSMVARYASRLATVHELIAEGGANSSQEALTRKISGSVGLPESDAWQMLEALFNLSAVSRQVRMEPARFIELVIQTFESEAPPDWKDKYLSDWVGKKELIAQVISALRDDPAVLTIRKTRELTYSYQNILTRSRIVTELRPVFNKDGDKIVHGVVLHSLLIDYSDSRGGTARIQLGMDAADIALLKAQCERAQTKSKAIQESFKDMPWGLTDPRSSSVPESE
jgi:hypothetical protein